MGEVVGAVGDLVLQQRQLCTQRLVADPQGSLAATTMTTRTTTTTTTKTTTATNDGDKRQPQRHTVN